MNIKPIGIFDSGVGGLTVLQEITKILPREQLIYLGDTARLPYGNKSPAIIERYSIENTTFLLEKNIKALVIACNTSSALALPALREKFDIPIIDVLFPGAMQAVSMTSNQRIGIMGTKGTIQSGAYQKAIHSIIPEALLFPVACPFLVHLVEEQWLDHPIVPTVIREYLQPLKNQNIDTLVLGCTHYPFLSSAIQQEIGSHVKLINPALACANQLITVLKEKNLLSTILESTHQYYVSDDPEKFNLLAKYLFAHSLPTIGATSLEPFFEKTDR